MTTTSPLGPSPTRSLCAPPWYDMSDRRVPTEDPRGGDDDPRDRWHRQDHSATPSDWRRSASGSYSVVDPRRQPLPAPAPHGLRYGSTFPYGAVASHERDRDVHQARRSPWHAETTQERPELYQRSRYEIDEDEEAPRRGMSSIQYGLDDQRRAGRDRLQSDRGEWGQEHRYYTQERRDESSAASRRGPMPSLGSLLQRSSFPGDNRDPEPSWRPREGHIARDEYVPRHSMDDVRAVSGPHDLSSSPYDRQRPLPGLHQLPSLAERRSLSPASDLGLSRASISSQETTRSSVSALARVASDMAIFDSGIRRRVHGSASPLRSTSYDSPRGATQSPGPPSRSAAQNWSSPARATAADASSTDSPAKRSRASSDEGDGGARPGGGATEEGAAPTPQRKKKKRKVRICTTPGCDKLVVDHGVCIRHGGGKRCNVEGCECRAQNKGLCWKHGGYTICQVDGCDKRAKSRGMCWSHGGGTQCKTDGCEKIAVSRGRCWAHGGGKRCKLPDCQKPAALRMDDYCTEHYAVHRAARANVASGRSGVDTRALYESWQ